MTIAVAGLDGATEPGTYARAILNILEDSNAERAGLLATERAVLNILEDNEREIAERKLAEDGLRRAKTAYFRSNPVPGLIARRVDNTFVEANDAFVALVGHTREELIGKSPLEVGIFVDPQELAAILGTLDRSGPARAEVTLRTRSGELRSVLSYVELTEIGGEACAIVGCVDLTDHKRAAILEQQQHVVEEANRAKSAFLANMSHELRTPLNAILGFSKLLLEQLEISDRQKRYLGNVHDAGRHLLDLINDVLDISRVEAGKMELRRESIDLAILLEPVIATTRLAADGRGVRFETTTSAAPIVTVDATRVRQILNNLLSNAVKFTSPGGSVQLLVAVEGDSLLVEVSDDGIGIPPESHGRVFGTFERFHERVDGPPGTGLGLALTKALVEVHGGTIRFESAEAVGTTFFVRLPGSIPHVGPGARLLIVEDDRRDADLVVALAERRGLTHDVVRSVAEALSFVERQIPAGIVLDLKLPDGRGETLLCELRDRGQHVPTVVVTVEDQRSVEVTAKLGVDDYLTKPIDAARLDRWLERLTIGEEGPLSADIAR